MFGGGRTRRLALLAATLTAGLLGSSGVANAVVIDGGSGSSPTGGSVHATCAGVVGLNTDFDEMTYAIEVEAHATHRNPLVRPVGGAVSCSILNAQTGAVYGTVRGGFPGPVTAAAGVIRFPSHATVRACVSANVIFSDGSAASFSTC
jgi:hypothetical protein